MSLLSKVILHTYGFITSFKKPKPGWLVQKLQILLVLLWEKERKVIFYWTVKNDLCAPRRGGNACPGDCSWPVLRLSSEFKFILTGCHIIVALSVKINNNSSIIMTKLKISVKDSTFLACRIEILFLN